MCNPYYIYFQYRQTGKVIKFPCKKNDSRWCAVLLVQTKTNQYRSDIEKKFSSQYWYPHVVGSLMTWIELTLFIYLNTMTIFFNAYVLNLDKTKPYDNISKFSLWGKNQKVIIDGWDILFICVLGIPYLLILFVILIRLSDLHTIFHVFHNKQTQYFWNRNILKNTLLFGILFQIFSYTSKFFGRRICLYLRINFKL